MKSISKQRFALVASTAAALVATAPAYAQNAPVSPAPPAEPAAESSSGGEILVTGSRIQRRDFDSESPIVTVSDDLLDTTGEIGLDQTLNELPQFAGGANQITSATDIQSTPTSSPGIATVNLRGLGSNRTLVLLDGRRTQPANASLVVDLNTIPVAAIDGIEIITGGAGATYGADAVAGVVNFRL
jgi:outer membrane receptor protein involved in Fe transport